MLAEFDYTNPANLLQHLRTSLPDNYRAILDTVFATAQELNIEVYVVGGIVRDLFLGRANYDLDFVCLERTQSLAEVLLKKVGTALNVYPAFGTANVITTFPRLGTEHLTDIQTRISIDLATARTEIYAANAALPTVSYPTSLETDLKRRDFTINAIAISPTQGLIDPFDGLGDLRQGLLRILHPASFADDPTRITRGVRFANRLSFNFEPQTRQALQAALAAHYFDLLTPARIWHELRLILLDANPARALAQLDELGILRVIHPSLHWSNTLRQRFEWVADERRSDAVALLAVLLSELDQPALQQSAKRLGLSNDDTALVLYFASSIQSFPPLPTGVSLSNSQIYRRLEGRPVRALELIADVLPEIAPAIHKYLNELRYIKPTLDGNYLKTLGLKPGPQYKQILSELLDAKLDGVVNSEADEVEWVRARLGSQ